MNTKLKRAKARVIRRNGSVLTGRRYDSVIEMMIGEKMPKLLIKRVQAILARDKLIFRAFMGGASMKILSRKYSVPLLAIEETIRVEMLTAPNK